MSEIVHERALALDDGRGGRFDLVRVHGQEQPDGTWHGWIEFRSAEGRSLETERETTQSHRDGLAYWASGLEPVYFEGALARVLGPGNPPRAL